MLDSPFNILHCEYTANVLQGKSSRKVYTKNVYVACEGHKIHIYPDVQFEMTGKYLKNVHGCNYLQENKYVGINEKKNPIKVRVQ